MPKLKENNFKKKSFLRKRQKLELLRSELENERVSFLPHWRDLGDFILPRRPRFEITDTNQGDKRNQKIIDNTATLAAGTLRAGMMGGVTSPARPWFKLGTEQRDLDENVEVKRWLDEVTEIMSSSFLRSNLYNILPIVYGDLGVFGTAAMYIEEDFSGDVLRAASMPIGSYMIAKDEKGRVDTFYREFRMTVRQLVERFGKRDDNGNVIWDNFTNHVKYLYEAEQMETWIDIAHVVMPNPDHDPDRLESKFKKYYASYYERGNIGTGTSYIQSFEQDLYLEESGFDMFPVLAPRWETTGEDVYATSCPGMTALGDIKQLQLGERRIMQAVEKTINPPMVGPTSLKNSKVSILPGDTTYVDIQSMQGFRPAHEVRFPINEMELKQQQVRERINRSFFADLFLMLANSDRRQITAREIEERHEEKLLALGPVLEQLNQDLLDPLIDLVFEFHLRQNLIPEPPEELQGLPLKVEYVSIMAQAQKLIGVSSLDRFLQSVGGIAQFDPNVLHKLDTNQMVDEYAKILSAPPKAVRSDEEANARIAAQQQQQQAMQRAQMLEQGSKAAKNLSDAELDGDNGLTRLLEQANAGNVVGGA